MEEAAQKICRHLAPFLARLTADGSVVEHVDESAWSNCVLNIALDRGPGLKEAKELFTLPANVVLWFNDDTHYSIENGLSCRECGHALSWPRTEKE